MIILVELVLNLSYCDYEGRLCTTPYHYYVSSSGIFKEELTHDILLYKIISLVCASRWHYIRCSQWGSDERDTEPEAYMRRGDQMSKGTGPEAYIYINKGYDLI